MIVGGPVDLGSESSSYKQREEEPKVHPQEGKDDATANALKALLRRAELRRDDKGRKECGQKPEKAIEEARKEAERGEVWWGCLLNTIASWWYLREPVDQCLAWPYGYAVNDGDGRGMRELKAETEQAIEAYDAVPSTRLQARLAELVASHSEGEERRVWMEKAFDAYMAAGVQAGPEEGDWLDDITGLKRAGAIGEHERIRRPWREILLQKAIEEIEQAGKQGNEWAWHIAEAIGEKATAKNSALTDLRKRVEELAQREEESESWLRARDSWLLVARMIRKNTEVQREARRYAAHCAAKEGIRRGQEKGGKIAGAHWLECGAEELRDVAEKARAAGQASQEDVAELCEIAGAWERTARSLTAEGIKKEMMEIETDPIDVTREVRSIRQAIQNEQGLTRIWKWMGLVPAAQYEKSAQSAREARGVLINHIPMTPISRRMESERTLKPGTKEYDRAEVVRSVEQLQEIQGLLLAQALAIEPDQSAIKALKEETKGAVERSSLIRPEQRQTVTHGLQKGIEGDWMSACYILTPILEEMIRVELEREGHSARARDTENLLPLARAIETAVECGLMTEDNAFELNALLVNFSGDGYGADMRNVVCHGVATDGDTRSWFAVWLWAKVLRWVDRDNIAT